MKAVAIFVLCLCSVVYAEEALTACQEDRARRINSTLEATDSPMLHLIPECEENGDYAALQCFTNKVWCVCYRRNGENINTPSKNIKACDCVRARDDALNTGAVGAFVPKCRKNGYYQPKQCLNDECWCVDQDGKSISEPQTGDVSCSG